MICPSSSATSISGRSSVLAESAGLLQEVPVLLQRRGTGGGIRQPGMELADRRDRVRIAAADPLLQVPGLVLQVLKARVDGKLTYRHDGLLSAGWRPRVQAG
jgi:hypothetical protein